MNLEIIENEIQKLTSDRTEIEKRIDALEQEKQNLVRNILAIDGAIQASNYYKQKMLEEQKSEEVVNNVSEEIKTVENIDISDITT